ncbi:MAG: hypothetical protein GF308_18320 [Candidatus Heimdallarchaeota archaeon]|nr:hypothetical protein [Candidatus Heimdallarchaeota archaeon]
MFDRTKLRIWGFLLSIFGCCQFIILTTIAILVYPGGSVKNPSASKYQFFYNFFSDLGLVQAINGENNLASRILFTIALTVVGFTLIFYFLGMPSFFRSEKITKWLSIIASINGSISAIAYIGIGFTPADVYIDWHMIFVYFGFTSLLLTTILYTIVIFLSKDFPNFYGWIYLIFSIAQFLYLIILYAGGLLFSSAINSLIQVIGQKVIVYVEIICFAIQSYGGWQVIKRKGKKTKTQKNLVSLET